MHEHIICWLKSLRDEAQQAETTISRTIEIIAIVAKYRRGI